MLDQSHMISGSSVRRILWFSISWSKMRSPSCPLPLYCMPCPLYHPLENTGVHGSHPKGPWMTLSHAGVSSRALETSPKLAYLQGLRPTLGPPLPET
jgi:hypothetical protein